MKCKVIAITGKIGSGKSAVGDYLKDLDYSVVDCDQLSRQVASSAEVLQKVETLLGKQYVKNGKLNRSLIRDKIFSDATLYKQYNDIFLEQIKNLLTTAVNQLGQSNDVVFVEIPLIDAFEFNWTEIWLVESCDQTRYQRVAQRDGVSRDSVADISNKQNYVTQPTLVLHNDGTLSQLFSQVDQALKFID